MTENSCMLKFDCGCMVKVTNDEKLDVSQGYFCIEHSAQIEKELGLSGKQQVMSEAVEARANSESYQHENHSRKLLTKQQDIIP